MNTKPLTPFVANDEVVLIEHFEVLRPGKYRFVTLCSQEQVGNEGLYDKGGPPMVRIWGPGGDGVVPLDKLRRP